MEPIDRVFIMKALTSSEGQAAIKAMTGPDAYAYFLDLVCSAHTIDPIRAAGGCYCRECRRCDGFPNLDIEQGEVGICKATGFMVHADDWCKWSKLREAQDDG